MALVSPLKMRLVITHTHNVSPQKQLLTFDLPQERLQRVPRIHDTTRPRGLVNDRDVNEPSLFHERKDVMQKIVVLAGRNRLRHHRGNSDVVD
jgi:hypothetical protein